MQISLILYVNVLSFKNGEKNKSEGKNSGLLITWILEFCIMRPILYITDINLVCCFSLAALHATLFTISSSSSYSSSSL